MKTISSTYFINNKGSKATVENRAFSALNGNLLKITNTFRYFFIHCMLRPFCVWSMISCLVWLGWEECQSDVKFEGRVNLGRENRHSRYFENLAFYQTQNSFIFENLAFYQTQNSFIF